MRKAQYSFYLGYLTHLLADTEWAFKIYRPSMDKFRKENEDYFEVLWKLKEDWYDQDFLYLKKQPDFHAFKVYENLAGFRNTFMDIFSEDAFENRRQYIVAFYHEKHDNLERVYPYLNEEQANAFVEETTKTILEKLKYYSA